MKYQKVIFHLEDGRKKYATHNGELLKWEEREVESLRANQVKHAKGAYTADFAKFDFSAKLLRERFPSAAIVKIIGFEYEDHDLPLQDDVIF